MSNFFHQSNDDPNTYNYDIWYGSRAEGKQFFGIWKYSEDGLLYFTAIPYATEEEAKSKALEYAQQHINEMVSTIIQNQKKGTDNASNKL